MNKIPTRQGTIRSPLAALRPRIIPVMDIMNGVVVRAVAGRRKEYKPLVSKLTSSTEPLAVAEALRDFVGTDELYVADLDAIRGEKLKGRWYAKLHKMGFDLLVDAGVRNANSADELIRQALLTVVVALETLSDPNELLTIVGDFGGDIVFSLDLKDGSLLCDTRVWPTTPQAVIDTAVVCGIQRIIVLDLGRVGTASGVGGLDLCAWAKSKYPDLEVIAGGGIRGPKDLPALEAAGVDGVLIASALHDGKFGLPGAPL